jgi:hypothetical protein
MRLSVALRAMLRGAGGPGLVFLIIRGAVDLRAHDTTGPLIRRIRRWGWPIPRRARVGPLASFDLGGSVERIALVTSVNENFERQSPPVSWATDGAPEKSKARTWATHFTALLQAPSGTCSHPTSRHPEQTR